MSLSATLQPKASALTLRNTRLSIVLVDTASPPGLALLLSGDLDTDTSGGFQGFIIEFLQDIKPPFTLILDLSALSYISSTGVGSLTAILSETRKRRLGLSIYGIPKHIWSIIDLLGFTAFFPVIDSYEACP